MLIRVWTRGSDGPRRGRLQHCSSHHPGKRVAMPTSGLPRPAARRGHTPFAHRSSLPLRPSRIGRAGWMAWHGIALHWHAPLGRSTRHSDTGTRGQTDTVHGRPCRGLAGRARHELKGGWPAGRGLSASLLCSPRLLPATRSVPVLRPFDDLVASSYHV